jgi:hypothetical protein
MRPLIHAEKLVNGFTTVSVDLFCCNAHSCVRNCTCCQPSCCCTLAEIVVGTAPPKHRHPTQLRHSDSVQHASNWTGSGRTSSSLSTQPAGLFLFSNSCQFLVSSISQASVTKLPQRLFLHRNVNLKWARWNASTIILLSPYSYQRRG